MAAETFTDKTSAAWASLLRATASLSRTLNAELVAEHGLTLSDYEALLVLSRAPERRLKRVELAQRVLLTPSGITRLLDGLQAAGYVEKASCPSDARVTYAVLTEAGLEKLEEAAPNHLRDVRELFGAAFSDDELDTLQELLARVGGEGAASCAPA